MIILGLQSSILTIRCLKCPKEQYDNRRVDNGNDYGRMHQDQDRDPFLARFRWHQAAAWDPGRSWQAERPRIE